MKAKSLAFAFLSLIGGCIGGAASSHLNNNTAIAQIDQQIPDIIQAKAMAIVDDSGTARIIIGTSKGTPVIAFRDIYKNIALTLGIDQGKPQIGFFKDDKKSMQLGYTKEGSLGMYMFDALEQPRVVNSVSSNGDPVIGIFSHDLKDLVGFSYETGIPYLQFQHNNKDRILMGLSAESGNGGLIFMNKYGKSVVNIGEGLNEGASMELNDKHGRSLVK
jgi:hypothetical protein